MERGTGSEVVDGTLWAEHAGVIRRDSFKFPILASSGRLSRQIVATRASVWVRQSWPLPTVCWDPDGSEWEQHVPGLKPRDCYL
jgi:hypothetical protein